MSRESIRRDLDNAAGEAFLPEGWRRLVKTIAPLLDVADAAAALVKRGLPHSNCDPEACEEAALEAALDRLEAA